jgi:hypothetical protein
MVHHGQRAQRDAGAPPTIHRVDAPTLRQFFARRVEVRVSRYRDHHM